MSDGRRDHFNVNSDYGPINRLVQSGGGLFPPDTGTTAMQQGTPRIYEPGFRYFSIQEVDPVPHADGIKTFRIPFSFYEIEELKLARAKDNKLSENTPAVLIVPKAFGFKRDGGQSSLVPVVVRVGGGVDYVLEDKEILSVEKYTTLKNDEKTIDKFDPKEHGNSIFPRRITFNQNNYLRADIAEDTIKYRPN